ncbi:hypothetical protein ACFQ3L_02615 [Lacticaseibacillus jixianensis]|uniref:Lipoprotein n=1 Tax=Lacticaseibacillus jixianensis TaxID=2486012 RepID=A0ABW4B6J6_9LACO|nr:hypothetical protein [Lacticaseibacillus jixianensis]
MSGRQSRGWHRDHWVKRIANRGSLLLGLVGCLLLLASCGVKHQLTGASTLAGKAGNAQYSFHFTKDGQYIGLIEDRGNRFTQLVEGSYKVSDDNVDLRAKRQVAVTFNNAKEFDQDVPTAVTQGKAGAGGIPRSSYYMHVRSGKVQFGPVTLKPSSRKLPGAASYYAEQKDRYDAGYGKLYGMPFVVEDTGNKEVFLGFKDGHFNAQYSSEQNAGEMAFASGTTAFDPAKKTLTLTYEEKTPLYQDVIDETATDQKVEYETTADTPFAGTKMVLKTKLAGLGQLTGAMGKFAAAPDSNFTFKQIMALDPGRIKAYSSVRRDPEDDTPYNADNDNLSDDEKIERFKDIAWQDYSDKNFGENTVVLQSSGRQFHFQYDFTSDQGRIVYKMYEEGEDPDDAAVGNDYGYDVDTGDIYAYTMESSDGDGNNHYSTDQIDSMHCTMPTSH